MSMESSEGLLEEIGAQALTAGVYQAPDAVLKAIDAITQNDVVKVCAFSEILIAWLNKQLQKNKLAVRSDYCSLEYSCGQMFTSTH